MAIDRVDAYLDAHRGRFEGQLKAFLRIPSVSAQPAHDADTRRAAEFLRDDLRRDGPRPRRADRVTAGHPLLYAEGPQDPGRPTVLIYGHYDVQPPEPLEPWTPRRSSRPSSRRQHRRAGGDRRQGADVHPPEGGRGVAAGRRRPPGQRQVPDRRRGGGRRGQPGRLRRRPPRPAGLRLRRDLRHQPVRPRHPGDHLRSQGDGVLRADRPRGQVRPPLGDVRRDGGQPAQRPGDDPREPQGAGRTGPDRRVLRRGPAARSLGAGRVRQAPVHRGGVPGPGRGAPRSKAKSATPPWSGAGPGRPATSTASSAATRARARRPSCPGWLAPS